MHHSEQFFQAMSSFAHVPKGDCTGLIWFVSSSSFVKFCAHVCYYKILQSEQACFREPCRLEMMALPKAHNPTTTTFLRDLCSKWMECLVATSFSSALFVSSTSCIVTWAHFNSDPKRHSLRVFEVPLLHFENSICFASYLVCCPQPARPSVQQNSDTFCGRYAGPIRGDQITEKNLGLILRILSAEWETEICRNPCFAISLCYFGM